MLQQKKVGNNFSLYAPLYSLSRNTVCEELENESRNGQCYKKVLNFFHSSSLNHQEFVALLEEVESEYGEIIYPSNVK
jgi:hypothetical protein